MNDELAGRSRLRSNRRFAQVWAATAASGIGDGLVFVAFPLLLVSTGDPLVTAGVLIAGRLPWLLLGLPAGAIVDRRDHRSLLTLVELGRAALLLGFAVVVVLGFHSVPMVLGTVFLIGVGETFFLSGSQAALPSLVPRQDLAQANGSLFAVQTATENLIGPAIAGLLFAIAVAVPFFVDAASFTLSAVLVMLAIPTTTRLPPPRRPLRRDIKEGLTYFRGHPALRSTAALIAMLAFCQAMVFGVVVLFATDVLGLSSVGFGLLVAGAAMGNVIGGALAGRLDGRFGPARLVPVTAVVAAIGYLAAGLTSNPFVSGAAFAVEAVAVAICSVSTIAFRQRAVPMELLGRVTNVYRFFIDGAAPVGALVGGVLAAATNLRVPFVAAAVGDLLVVALLGPGLVRALSDGHARPVRVSA
jgi:MFS family permease